MQRRDFLKWTGATGMITIISGTVSTTFNSKTLSELEENFLYPPDSAKPYAMWFWMNGNISKEGITLDLEAMKSAGIGGVFNFDASSDIPKGPVEYFSEEWLQLKKHAIQEADRLGLGFVMHNCPGWSASGGPWITPESSMQQITWSELYVSGGKQINTSLPKPVNRLNYYQDLVVLAFPSLAGEAALQNFNATLENETIDLKKITGEDPEGVIVRPVQSNLSAYLQFEFNEPYEARSITFLISSIPKNATVRSQSDVGEKTSVLLEASDDGIQFRPVTSINTGFEIDLLAGDKLITYDIPATKAKYFRLVSSGVRRYRQVRFSGITRLINWMEKANHRPVYIGEVVSIFSRNDQEVPDNSVIDLSTIVDISHNMDKDGVLKWNAPSGNWTILRIGFTSTGKLIRAAPDIATGLECDKYSRAAMDLHFNKMFEHLMPVIEPLAVKRRMGLEIESYEAGMQNWTPGFSKEFQKRWGYDLSKYLPAITGGRVVSKVDNTERFLWDFRRLQADLMAENFYGRFHELCHEHSLTSYIEPYDQGPMEEMQIGSKTDVNLGEFWYGIFSLLPAISPTRRTSKLAASIAHINNQKIVGAEAFTAEPESAKWQEYPFALKAVGDKAFTKGVNRMAIACFAHQPHISVSPGMTMGPWGTNFDRNNTWWTQGKAWVSYLTRCQSLLQQGHFVADLVYFTGEDGNMFTKVTPDELNPTPADGYDYDLINAETILKRVKIVNKQIVLTTGMTYRILVLQNYKAITLELLHKLYGLVKEGMVLVGAKPERSLGLSNYDEGDTRFKHLVNELWSNIDGYTATEHQFGKGYVFWGPPLRSILQKLNINPDFELSSRSGDAPLMFTHRKTGDTDIYFITNQRRTYEDTVCTFRVTNRQPELWDPSTGKITTCSIYETVDNGVRLPIQLQPYGSALVVFRLPASGHHLHSIKKDNVIILNTKPFQSPPRKLYTDVFNNFTICFWAKPEMNILLNPGIMILNPRDAWTEFYAIYPSPAKQLYGEGHATCGLAVGRNGVAVWERSGGNPVLMMGAPITISGWSHIAFRYKDNISSVYVNGKLIQEGKKGDMVIHPGLGETYLQEGASYYNGDMTEPILFPEVLSADRIFKLANEELRLKQTAPFIAEVKQGGKPSLLIYQNGNYSLLNSAGQATTFQITGIDESVEIEGPWQVKFAPMLGAPSQIALSKLISLHKHSDDGVKYFSGTATYTHGFSILHQKLNQDKRLLLDLGRVEVIAEVSVNGKDFDILWKRPYMVDVTNAIKPGINKLEIKITNVWPNRLIGDEQMPEHNKFLPRGSPRGLESLTGDAIQELPNWYIQNKSKPLDGRITFATWKHYTKDSPLLESGLIGPVRLLMAVEKML
jgi:hypothetical protein